MKSSPALFLILIFLAVGLGFALELAWPTLRVAWLLYVLAVAAAGQMPGKSDAAWVAAGAACVIAYMAWLGVR